MLPLDAHAHIEPDIASSELVLLRSCVVAVTRSLDEYRRVARRDDASVAWGVGCHPGLARAVRDFDPDSFRAALASSAIVGEVGLDGASKVSLNAQQDVLTQVFSALETTPRLVSVHSYRATKPVLHLLEQHQPKGVILHWWLGDHDDTTRAVELGAYFSVNAAQATRWSALPVVPSDRILTETDHPFGDRRESPPQRPGNVQLAERRIGQLLDKPPAEVRSMTWRNLRGLVDELDLHDLLPRQFQVQLLAA